jgi:hypothetical protein
VYQNTIETYRFERALSFSTWNTQRFLTVAVLKLPDRIARVSKRAEGAVLQQPEAWNVATR